MEQKVNHGSRYVYKGCLKLAGVTNYPQFLCVVQVFRLQTIITVKKSHFSWTIALHDELW
jgi:hypothetical protein